MSATLTPVSTRPLRIFLVENHADTLEYLKMYVEMLGHTVIAARTMHEALSQLPDADCDVLVSDIGLSDGDGWELLRRARPTRPIYAVAISAHSRNADQLRSKQAGYRHHLFKPFDPSKFDAVLEEAACELAAAEL